jgi:type II secretory pathway pseudopilin PulG
VNDDARLRLIEITSVLVIIACVVAIVIPKTRDMQRRSAATQVLVDLEAMRSAVYAFYSDSAYFPAETPGEAIPSGLSRYLPPSFSDRTPYGTIRYKNWPRPVGSALSAIDGAPNSIIGAVVTTSDARVGGDAVAMAPAMPEFTVGTAYGFIFFGS